MYALGGYAETKDNTVSRIVQERATQVEERARWIARIRTERRFKMAEAESPPEKGGGKARRTAEASEESDGDSSFDCHY